MKRIISFVVFLAIMSVVPLFSQEYFEKFIRNEAQKNNDFLWKLQLAEAQVSPNQEMFDVHFYSLDIEVFPEIKNIRGKAMICAHALSDLERMELNFYSSNEVHGVYLVEHPDSSLEFLHQSGIIDIQMDKTYTEGEEVKILVDYTAWNMDWGVEFHKYQDLDLIFSWDPKGWFPCKDTPGDKADSSDLKVTVPLDLVVASNGLLKEISQTDTSSTYFWQERYPIANFYMCFAAYPYEIYTDWYVNAEGDSLEIQMFTIPYIYDQVKDVYAKEKEMLAFYEDYFGPYPFPLEKHGHAEVDQPYSMEFQTLTSFGVSRLLEDEPEILIAHEMAHAWLGSSVSFESYHHIWIVEGFATYATAMWYEFKESEETLKLIMKMFEYYGTGTPYIEDPETQDIFDSNLTYSKPAWVYHMLRHMVGDQIFSDIIKEITTEPSCAYGSITTDEFREICERVSGLNLEKFIQQWVMGQGYPNYSYSWTYTENEPGYELELILNQIQAGQVFWMPVDVAVQTAVGVENFVIWDSLETQVFKLTLNDLPQSVELDPDNWVLNKANDVTGMKYIPVNEKGILAVPNPFKGSVEFTCELQSSSNLSLTIFNELGEEVEKLVYGFYPEGTHSVSWNAGGNDPGIYFYRFKSGDQVHTGKLILTE